MGSLKMDKAKCEVLYEWDYQGEPQRIARYPDGLRHERNMMGWRNALVGSNALIALLGQLHERFVALEELTQGDGRKEE